MNARHQTVKAVYVRATVSRMSGHAEAERLRDLLCQEEHVEFYIDEDSSSLTGLQDRLAGKQLIEDVKLGLVKEIIVFHLSTLSGSPRELVKTLQFFADYSVELTTVNGYFTKGDLLQFVNITRDSDSNINTNLM